MTQAAKELHLTQSGVSQQIKALEEALNITLFDRVNRRIIPTNEAEILYEECSRRLDELERALSQMSNQDRQLIGTVRVGLSPEFAHDRGISLISQFASQHSMVRINFSLAPAHRLSLALAEGRLDFAVLDTPPSDKHLLFNKVSQLELILVFGSQFRLPENSQELFDFFSKLTFITDATGDHKLRDWFQLQFSKIPANLQTRFSVADSPSSLALSKITGAAALIPKSMESQVLSLNECQIAPLASLELPIGLSRLRKRTMGAAAETCYQWLLKQLHQKNRS